MPPCASGGLGHEAYGALSLLGGHAPLAVKDFFHLPEGLVPRCPIFPFLQHNKMPIPCGAGSELLREGSLITQKIGREMRDADLQAGNRRGLWCLMYGRAAC